jgi:hypothetical protein
MQIGSVQGSIPRENLGYSKRAVPLMRDSLMRAGLMGAPSAPKPKREPQPVLRKIEMEPVMNYRLKYVVDSESARVIVKVIDGETDKVIKELPPEELRRLAAGKDPGALLNEEA